MATSSKKAAKKQAEGEVSGVVELGEFTVKALNDGGAEGRLSDERGQSSIIIRRKGVNGQLKQGGVYRVSAELVEGTEGGETVLVNVPVEEVKNLPEGSEVAVR